MKTIKQFALILAILLTRLLSQAQPAADSQPNFTLHFLNVVGQQPMQLNDTYYNNAAGEKFNVTTFNYFISNIKLSRKDGTAYVLPEDSTYYLIRESDPATRDIKLRVPPDEYTAVTFIIGVDSLMSTSDLTNRRGALDISGGMLDGMYWTWNSGYLFVKFEGDCQQAPVDRTGQRKFRYHIGGYGGYKTPSLNNIKRVSLPLAGSGDTRCKAQVTVKIQADALKIFDGRTPIRIADHSAVMFGEQSKVVADNYSSMFSIVTDRQ